MTEDLFPWEYHVVCNGQLADDRSESGQLSRVVLNAVSKTVDGGTTSESLDEIQKYPHDIKWDISHDAVLF